MDTATVTLGETPLARIGLVTNRLTHTPENVAFIREAVAAGVSLIDTAHVYTGGESEDTIGAALSSPPAGCLVATSRRAAEVRRSSRDSPGSALASRTPPGW